MTEDPEPTLSRLRFRSRKQDPITILGNEGLLDFPKQEAVWYINIPLLRGAPEVSA